MFTPSVHTGVAEQVVDCKSEKVTVTDADVHFTNIAEKGDCMGDALRGQGKDPTKYFFDINSDGSLTFHSDGYPDLKMTSCSGVNAPASTCTLYEVSGATCGQSELDCTYEQYAKKAEPGLKDGTCTDQGYTVKGTTTTKHYPIVGDITVTQYTKPA